MIRAPALVLVALLAACQSPAPIPDHQSATIFDPPLPAAKETHDDWTDTRPPGERGVMGIAQ